MSDQYVAYKNRPEWKDVHPIQQNDGDNPAVPIAYTEKFKDVMNYFRGVVKKQEKSDRVLDLLEDVIDQNPANYTAWFYRRLCLFELKKDLNQEMKYIDNIILDDNEKNYQVWYHRQQILDHLGVCGYEELNFIDKTLAIDAKNYHVWQHRQWVVQRFKLWDNELQTVDNLLEEDFRNNSAWNHRFFVIKHVKGTTKNGVQHLPESVRNEEIQYAFKYLDKAPNNESAWNYAFGMANYVHGKNPQSFELLKSKTQSILDRVSVNIHAHWVLLECLVYEGLDEKTKSDAITLCTNLMRFDGIRKKYWFYRKEQIENM